MAAYETETVDQVVLEVLLDGHLADVVQSCLDVEGVQQAGEAVAPAVAAEEVVVAEVVEARGLTGTGEVLIDGPDAPATPPARTRVRTSGAAGLSSQRRMIQPRRRPPVSSQWAPATPGSSPATSSRTRPSGPGGKSTPVPELCRRDGSRHSCQMFSSVTDQ